VWLQRGGLVSKVVKDLVSRVQGTDEALTLNPSAEQLRGFIDSIPTLAWSAASDGAAESFNQRWLDYTGLSASEGLGWGWKAAIHPDDLPRLLDAFQRARESGQPFEFEGRLRRFDGEFRRFLMRGDPVRDERGSVVTWYGTNTDLEDRARAEDALRLSAEGLRLIVDTIPGLVAIMTAGGEVELVNHRVLEYFGRTLEELKHWGTSDAVHPDDLPGVVRAWTRSVETGTPYDFEHRLRRADGTYRWFQSRGHPLRDVEGRVIRWYNLLTDIDDLKRAQMKLRQDEEELRQITDATPQAIIVFSADGRPLYANRFTLAYTGLSLGDFRGDGWRERIYHPDDIEKFKDARREGLALGVAFESELRVLGADGKYRWFLIRYNPLLDDDGNVTRWYATGMDIDERKGIEDRLRSETVALRQDIERSLMFEEIVGSSPVLQAVISSITKVAPTDSTVLIAGETGTGKELIARAIHKHSRRSEQVFVSVNCAAIPPSLIASELFGHEKGAFTGAVEQRRGRFELAHSGTIFLDEIGDVPMETQIALLRVLQERQIERVGGTRAISVDVRVIAATNRDLSAAVAGGAFRSDLFYRLNVFPIQVPPLRRRKEDIPLLVEYFVRKCAERMGKRIRKIDQRTLELCEAYAWPGNIRELQNIVERSVILCAGDTLTIDEAWLSVQAPSPADSPGRGQTLQDREKEAIEAALAEANGKVAGVTGAAAKLGLPASTLESKIRRFKIDKRRFTSSTHH
jgi:formate hydrogenlyase transcriptional activator